jgi:hypothetical protein
MVPVFCNYNITPPRLFRAHEQQNRKKYRQSLTGFSKSTTLDILDSDICGKLGAGVREDWIEHDVWILEVSEWIRGKPRDRDRGGRSYLAKGMLVMTLMDRCESQNLFRVFVVTLKPQTRCGVAEAMKFICTWGCGMRVLTMRPVSGSGAVTVLVISWTRWGVRPSAGKTMASVWRISFMIALCENCE